MSSTADAPGNMVPGTHTPRDQNVPTMVHIRDIWDRESGKNQTCGDIYKVRECGSIKIRVLNLWYLAVVRYEI